MTRQLRHTVTTSYVTDGRFFFPSFFFLYFYKAALRCYVFSFLSVARFHFHFISARFRLTFRGVC